MYFFGDLLSEIENNRHGHGFIVVHNICIIVLNFAGIEICVEKFTWVYLNTYSSKTKCILIKGIPFFIHRETEIFLALVNLKSLK